MPWNVWNSNWVSQSIRFILIHFFNKLHRSNSIIFTCICFVRLNSSKSQWNRRRIIISSRVCTSDFRWKWMHFWLQRFEDSSFLYGRSIEHLHGHQVHITHRRYTKWWTEKWWRRWRYLQATNNRLLLHKYRWIFIEIGQRRIVCAVRWEAVQLECWEREQHTSHIRNLRVQHWYARFSCVPCTIADIFVVVRWCCQLHWHNGSELVVFGCVSVHSFL